MLKKQQIDELLKGKSASSPFIARVPTAAGAETASASVTVTTYLDEAGSPIIANADLPHALSPFTGKEMRRVHADKMLELTDEELKDGADFTKACTCQNADCGVDLYVLTEVASAFGGEQFHCTVCKTVNTIETTADVEDSSAPTPTNTDADAAAAEQAADAADADAAAEKTTPDDTATAAEDQLNEEEVDAVIQAAQDEEDDDAGDDDDDASDEDDEDELEIIEDDTDKSDEDDDDGEIASVVTDVQDKATAAAVETSALAVDVSAQYDFSPETISLLPLTQDHSRYAVAAFDSGVKKTVVVAYLERDGSAEDLRGLFTPEKTRALRDAVIAAGQAEDFSRLGIEAIVATVDIERELLDVAQATALQVEQTKEEIAQQTAEEYANCLQIAFAGMNKGTFVNPLLDEVAATLDSLGIERSNLIAARMLDNACNAFALAALEQADDLMLKPKEVREAIASTIDKSVASLTDAVERTTDTTVRKRSVEVIPATAHVVLPPAETATAAKPPRNNNMDGLFAGLGQRAM